MEGQQLVRLDRLCVAASVLVLLITALACVACNAPLEVISQPTVTISHATDTPSPPIDAVIVEPVLGTVPTAVVTPTSVVPANVGRDFSFLAGTWASEDEFTPVFEIDANGTFTFTYDYDDLTDVDVELPSLVFTGVITVEDDQYLVDIPFTTSLVPHGNLLLVDGYFDYVLRKVGLDGRFQPYQPVNATRLPGVDSSAVISVSIVDSWTGLSPLAPVESNYKLNAGEDGLMGTAFFSVAGYGDPITATTAISLPLAAWQEALEVLGSTSLETIPYLPVFSFTDYYPSVLLVIKTRDQEYRFESKSQGQGYVPWKVTVDDQEYVTFSDNPTRALQILQPYLAKNVLDALKDEAWPR